MTDNSHSYLVNWAIDFLKNKDLIARRIESLEKGKDGFDFFIKFKDKEQFFLVRPVIDNVDEIISKFDETRHFGLFVFNTVNNFNIFVKNWDKFAKIKNLAVYFVNPLSQVDKKWIVHPCTHNNICEKSSLERGLRSMFEIVEPLTEAVIKDTFK